MNKKKIMWHSLLVNTFFIFIGVVCGILMVEYSSKIYSETSGMGEIIFSYFLLFAGMYIAIFAQILIHEAGHLIFGLLSGYRFVSFRIGSFILLKEKEGIKLKRLSLLGTGGQCLMSPPEFNDGKMPFMLYNLGGSIANVISAAVFLFLCFVCESLPLLSAVMLIFAFIGIAYALINGIPMRLGTVDNDGYNTLSMKKSCEAVYSFWVQLKVNEESSKGVRLKEMPDEWFYLPSDQEMKNSITSVMGVILCNRLIDQKKFEEAYGIMKKILESDTAVVGLHRSLLTCECIFCQLMCENPKEKTDLTIDKQQKNFMKAMRKYPSVIRCEYAYALLCENDRVKAMKIRKTFEKTANNYPYSSDIEGEWELIFEADKIFEEKR